MADPVSGIPEVNAKIAEIVARRKNSLFNLCRKYANKSEKYIKDMQTSEQGKGEWWTNQTSQAIKLITGFTMKSGDYVGWGVAHRVEYGVYLELANNREHAVLLPTIQKYTPQFLADAKKIWEKGEAEIAGLS
jgi:hypothetical protein